MERTTPRALSDASEIIIDMECLKRKPKKKGDAAVSVHLWSPASYRRVVSCVCVCCRHGGVVPLPCGAGVLVISATV